MNSKILLPLIFSILLISGISAMTVYSDFSDSSQTATITVGQSVSFNADFFSMNPPITSMKVQLFQGNSLISTFLNSNTNSQTYSNTYTYTANTAGTYKIQTIGTDGVNTDSETLTLTVNPVSPADTTPPVITILGSNPVTIQIGSVYHDAGATAVDNVDGLITSRIHTTNNVNTNIVGTYTVTYSVSDNAGNSATATRTVYVIPSNPINHAPVITSSPVTTVNEGSSYYYNVDATDADGDTLTYLLISAPSWLSINTGTGVISGVAPLVSSDTNYNVQVRVSDGTNVVTQSYMLTVITSNPNNPPVITIISPEENHEYNTCQLSIKVSTNEQADVTFRLDEGVVVEMNNPSDNTYTYTLNSLSDGKHYLTFYATDNAGNQASESISFFVKNSKDNNNEIETNSVGFIPNNFYDDNRYYDQFAGNVINNNGASTAGGVIYDTNAKTQTTTGISITTWFYIIMSIIGLGIIIAFVTILRNIR